MVGRNLSTKCLKKHKSFNVKKFATLVIDCYYNGIFPMSHGRDEDEIYFVNPNKRGIIPLNKVHISRSLKRSINKQDFIITNDKAFTRVINSCASQEFGRKETWINKTIIDLFKELHSMGKAHSIEIWKNQSLVGGIYGLSLGSVFFAESMFSAMQNASKITLIYLLAKLKHAQFKLFDIQYITPHLSSMGGIEISKKEYMNTLKCGLEIETEFPKIDSSQNADWLIISSYLQEMRDMS